MSSLIQGETNFAAAPGCLGFVCPRVSGYHSGMSFSGDLSLRTRRALYYGDFDIQTPDKEPKADDVSTVWPEKHRPSTRGR
ncbi:hypothetical protein E4U61_004049 [Claviceps capensis]|nr:hypothetical protein E4U61_004049 [Claviceps capensis]